jgi:hypothetical protein
MKKIVIIPARVANDYQTKHHAIEDSTFVTSIAYAKKKIRNCR